MRRNFLRLMIVRDVSEAVLQEGVAHRGNIGPGLPAKPIGSEDRKHLFRPHGLSKSVRKAVSSIVWRTISPASATDPLHHIENLDSTLGGIRHALFFLEWSLTILIRDTLGRNVFFIEEVPILPGAEIFHIIRSQLVAATMGGSEE